MPVAEQEAAPGTRHGVRRVLPLLLALVAIASAVVLPFAPVAMSIPTVSWPQTPGHPVSTMLQLTNQEPLALDVRFSCAAVRAASATPEGVVVSTLVPGTPAAETDGLHVTARGGQLRVLSRGQELTTETIGREDCAYRIQADAGGLAVLRDATTLVETPVGDGPDALPDVDVLATSIERLPTDEDLGVRITVDNQFNTTPTGVKQGFVLVLLLSALGSLLALRSTDRRARSASAAAPSTPASGRVALLVDAVVVATLLLWWFIAPLSDDDGYYAAMARNASAEGFVGQYYQLLNQSFTPFTWFYRLLGWWEQVGNSPVVLRLPALVVGLGTWVLLRRLIRYPAALPQVLTGHGSLRLVAVVLLAATFLAWWLPYGMGVRPEATVGFLALVALSGVLAGLQRERLLPVALAFGAAALAIACHPTGFVALGPLLVSLPRLARLAREGATSRLEVLTRTALVLAPGAFASAAAFADGSLNDFLRGQEIFLSIQEQNGWYDEIYRYGFLLTPGPMGSYARRAAVLLGIVALMWFMVLAVAARAREVRVPLPLLLAAQSLSAGFLLLWLTPSKWTHHFGALSGLGPAFLALFLASAPVLLRQVTRDRPLGRATPVALVGSLVLVFALAFQGPNVWAYTWAPGIPHPGEPPYVWVVELGNPLVWLVLAGIVVGTVARIRRRRSRPRGPVWPAAVPVLVLLFLATSVGYLLGSFGYATARTLDGYSPWADALVDPLSADCALAGALRVADVSDARPLVPQGTAPAEPVGFERGSGWYAPSPPPAVGGQGVARDVWGSLTGADAENGNGAVETPWYALPAAAEGDTVAVLAAGLLGPGNGLRVEYSTSGADGRPRVVRTEVLQDTLNSPRWRTFVLEADAAREDGADALRLVAEDQTGGPGGWLAFTGPSVLPVVPLQQYLPEGAAVAEAWQVSFLFPCQRQPEIHHGITEPVEYGVVWRNGPEGDGLADNTWQVFRGGLFAPVVRTSGVTELAAYLPSAPRVRDLQVFRFVLPYATESYDLTLHRVTRAGWDGPPG